MTTGIIFFVINAFLLNNVWATRRSPVGSPTQRSKNDGYIIPFLMTGGWCDNAKIIIDVGYFAFYGVGVIDQFAKA
jgi:hypothetical protein